MQVLITTKPHKCGFLKTWLAWSPWWYVRRFHVFNAFRATDSTPTTNLAESVHASWANTQATNITLLEAAYHDISESIRLEQQLKAFSEGIYKEGTGPSAIHVEQQKWNGLTNMQLNFSVIDLHSAQADFEVHADPQCSHKPTKCKSSSKQSKGKKCGVSTYLQEWSWTPHI